MNVFNWILKHWALVTSFVIALSTCAWRSASAVNQLQAHIAAVDDRLTWVESTHPEATAELATQNAATNQLILRKLDDMQKDLTVISADTAFTRGKLGFTEH